MDALGDGGPSPCGAYTAEVVPLPVEPGNDVQVAATASTGAVLLSDGSPERPARLFVVRGHAVEEPVALSTNFAPFDATASPEGELFLVGGTSGGTAGQVWRGRPSRGFRPVGEREPQTRGVGLRGVAFTRRGSSSAIYALGDYGALERYDLALEIWALILPPDPDLRAQGALGVRQGIAAGEGDEIAAILPHVDPLAPRVIVRFGAAGLERITTNERVTVPAYSPGLGFIFGHEDGRVLRLVDRRLEPVPGDGGRSQSITVLRGTRDGFVASGINDTSLAEYYVGFGYCPPTAATSLRHVVAVAAHRDGYAVSGQGHVGQAPTLWLYLLR